MTPRTAGMEAQLRQQNESLFVAVVAVPEVVKVFEPYRPLSCRGHFQICEIARRPVAHPKTDPTRLSVAQLLYLEAGCCSIVDEDAHLGMGDHDPDMHPSGRIGGRINRVLELLRSFRPELLPRVGRVGYVLHRVVASRRIRRSEIERAEIDGVVRFLIEPVKSDADKAPLEDIAAFHVEFDRPVRKLGVRQPGEPVAHPFVESKDSFAIRRRLADGAVVNPPCFSQCGDRFAGTLSKKRIPDESGCKERKQLEETPISHRGFLWSMYAFRRAGVHNARPQV